MFVASGHINNSGSDTDDHTEEDASQSDLQQVT